MSYSTLNGIEVVLIAGGLVGWWLRWLVLKLRRSRPGLRIGYATAVGVGARFVSLAAVGSLGVAQTLRGGDEVGFTQSAHALARTPFLSSGWLPQSGSNPLHVVFFALEYKLGGFTDAALRIMQVGIAMTGLLLIAAATYELSGPRAARWTAWALALEPANIFFSGLLHKESNMMLASGLIVFGATKFWLRMRWQPVLLIVLGASIAITTRAYAGWFLVAGAVLVCLHAAVRHFDVRRGGRSFAVVYAIVVGAIVLAPTLLALSSHQSLQQNLQVSQTANTTASQTPGVAVNGNNLELEQVNFSSRSAIVSNLPQRLRDLLLRPYVWQLGSVNQQVALPGSLVALLVLVLLARYAWLARHTVLRSAAPLPTQA